MESVDRHSKCSTRLTLCELVKVSTGTLTIFVFCSFVSDFVMIFWYFYEINQCFKMDSLPD